jgi:drug/metabolite transporter (DMT)-like permease
MTTAEDKRQNEAIWRAYSVLALFIVLKAVGNLSLAWGMKRFPQTMSASPLPYLRAMLDPFVALGVLTLILALLTRMALFSLADLSFVLPVTAVGYIIAVILGKTFLHETISPRRWAGAVLIALGAALVGSGSHKTEVEIE